MPITPTSLPFKYLDNTKKGLYYPNIWYSEYTVLNYAELKGERGEGIKSTNW